MEKFDALICAPDVNTRMRLKSATGAVAQFGKVVLYPTLEQAKKTLEEGKHIDVIFLSYEFEEDEVKSFIVDGKKLEAGQDAAYVLVLNSDNQDSTTVAQNVMIGADGFLFEPYSVDQLVEITNLAAKVKRERSRAREKAALKFLLNDILNNLDTIAYLRSSGVDVGRAIKNFSKLCKTIHDLSDESIEVYKELVLEEVADRPFPAHLKKTSYKGASRRIKKKMQEKMLKELEASLESSG